MKKVLASSLCNYKMPHLFRDNIARIEGIVDQAPIVSSFKITTGGYGYDSVNEIPKDLRVSHNMKLVATPYVRLELAESNAHLFAARGGIQVSAPLYLLSG